MEETEEEQVVKPKSQTAAGFAEALCLHFPPTAGDDKVDFAAILAFVQQFSKAGPQTPEEAASKDAAAKALSRGRETDAQRQQRRENDAAAHKNARSEETPEQTQDRLGTMRDHAAKVRSEETPEQTQDRLAWQAGYDARESVKACRKLFDYQREEFPPPVELPAADSQERTALSLLEQAHCNSPATFVASSLRYECADARAIPGASSAVRDVAAEAVCDDLGQNGVVSVQRQARIVEACIAVEDTVVQQIYVCGACGYRNPLDVDEYQCGIELSKLPHDHWIAVRPVPLECLQTSCKELGLHFIARSEGADRAETVPACLSKFLNVWPRDLVDGAGSRRYHVCPKAVQCGCRSVKSPNPPLCSVGYANIESCVNPVVDLCKSCHTGLSNTGPHVPLDASAQSPGLDPHSDCWLDLYTKTAPRFSIARGLDVGDCSGYGAAVDFDFSLVEIVMLAPVRVHLTLKKVRHHMSVCAR